MLFAVTFFLGYVIAISLAANNVLLYSNTTTLGQLVTSSTLVWEPYTSDPNQFQYAVPAATFVTELDNYTMFVCRALNDGIYTTGHTQKQTIQNVCIVAMHMEKSTHASFDILLNKGNSGKLTWMPWTKFSAGIPKGSVSAVSTGHVEDVYVARHKYVPEVHSEHNHGADYNVGRFAPKQSLGKIIVSEGQKDKEYEEGEILVESDPQRYELRNIKNSKWRNTIKRNLTELGSVVLSNDDKNSNLIESVISYEYDKVFYWGSLEGVSRGLPTSVFETGKPEAEFKWGLTETVRRTDTKTVSHTLQPGTAINVTMTGNYTTIDGPYNATLVSFYADSDEPIFRKIDSNLLMSDMVDIKIEFSPVYWIHNMTFLPTTTTTTTTTTSTTTSTTEADTVNMQVQMENGAEINTSEKNKNNSDRLSEDNSKTSSSNHIKCASYILLLIILSLNIC